MLLRYILIIQFSLNFNCKLFSHQNKKVGYWQVGVNHHTTTPQYSIQRQPSTKNSSIGSIVQQEYFEMILGKVLFHTVTNGIEKLIFLASLIYSDTEEHSHNSSCTVSAA